MNQKDFLRGLLVVCTSWSALVPAVRPAMAAKPLPISAAADIVLVGFSPAATPNERALVRASVNAAFHEPLSPLAKNAEKIRLAGGQSVDAVIARLLKNPHVVYAEPDYRLELAATSNDPSYTNGTLWGMYCAVRSSKPPHPPPP